MAHSSWQLPRSTSRRSPSITEKKTRKTTARFRYRALSVCGLEGHRKYTAALFDSKASYRRRIYDAFVNPFAPSPAVAGDCVSSLPGGHQTTTRAQRQRLVYRPSGLRRNTTRALTPPALVGVSPQQMHTAGSFAGEINSMQPPQLLPRSRTAARL